MFNKAQKPSKKAYKKHMDSFYKQLQAKPVELVNKGYVLYGQPMLINVSLFSHFDIFDKYGKGVKKTTAKRVHNFIQKFFITETVIKSLQNNLLQLADSKIHKHHIHQ